MYTLKEYITVTGGELLNYKTNGKLLCLDCDAKMLFLTNETQGYLLCYTFSLVTQGWCKILYNNREITLREGDIYIYSPGFQVTVLSASDDYRFLCLMADENFALSQDSVRQAIRTTYYLVVIYAAPVFALTDSDRLRLQEMFQMMIHYQQSGLSHADECQRILFNLFITDFAAIQESIIRQQRRLSKRVEDIFIEFIELLPNNFAEHHDIAFYASKLCITTTYLSRVVRKVSCGRTVADYINHFIMMESIYLLNHTSLSITQIANQLNFAEVTTFARFFRRAKGVTPREFRKKEG